MKKCGIFFVTMLLFQLSDNGTFPCCEYHNYWKLSHCECKNCNIFNRVVEAIVFRALGEVLKIICYSYKRYWWTMVLHVNKQLTECINGVKIACLDGKLSIKFTTKQMRYFSINFVNRLASSNKCCNLAIRASNHQFASNYLHSSTCRC